MANIKFLQDKLTSEQARLAYARKHGDEISVATVLRSIRKIEKNIKKAVV